MVTWNLRSLFSGRRQPVLPGESLLIAPTVGKRAGNPLTGVRASIPSFVGTESLEALVAVTWTTVRCEH